jgi:hypothetical protein
MRAVEFLMMTLAVAVLALGVWAVHKWIPRSGLSFFRPPSTEAPRVPAPPASKPAPTSPTHKRAAHSQSDLGIPLGIVEVDVPTGFPFPTPADLPAGFTRAQIIAKYGEPTVRVSGVEDGRLFERYYFIHHDRTRMTIATLRNGVVARAESALNEHATVGTP